MDNMTALKTPPHPIPPPDIALIAVLVRYFGHKGDFLFFFILHIQYSLGLVSIEGRTPTT